MNDGRLLLKIGRIVMHIEQRDPRLVKIVNQLKEKYDCHTIILYGSRARGDETAASDYDIIAIRDKGEMERDCRKFEGVFLDVFIYSLEEIKQPSDFLRIKDGIVICEKNKIGSELLEKVRDCYKKGPIPKSAWEKQVIAVWGQKMLERANIGDVEGDFRAHWLIYDLLEEYFQLRDLWYLGPKEAFQWLKANDAAIYGLFEKVLSQGINLKQLKILTEKINLITPPSAPNTNSTIQIIESSQAEKVCRELTSGLPEWFGISEANERYAKGCAERTSFAAMIDNNYIGMITLEFPFKNNANIYWMAVNRKYHGHNIGLELLQAAERYCAENGYDSITVETLSPKQSDPNYLKTYHFYEKNGFKPLFELSPYGPELLMCYMIKSINEIAYD